MNTTETAAGLAPTANTIYCGSRTASGDFIVTADARPLSGVEAGRLFMIADPSFCWGWFTPGAFRLAYQLLVHATRGNLLTANDLYGDYAREVVTQWPKTGFATSRALILQWIASKVCPLPMNPPPAPENRS